MRRSFFLVLLATLAGSAAGCAGYASRAVTPSTPVGIAVTGHGEARGAPDVAVLSVSVEVHRGSMIEARDAAASAASRMLAAVARHGVAANDVQTAQLSLQPEYDYSESGRRLLGYVATNSIRVRVCDLPTTSAVLDAVVDAAGDDARVDGVTFEITEPAPLRAEARERAVADARVRAEALAASLGVRLGDPISVEELSGASPVGPMLRHAAYGAADAATPISGGQLEASVDLQVRWAIRR